MENGDENKMHLLKPGDVLRRNVIVESFGHLAYSSFSPK
jgi:hypothetical protein